MQINNRGINTVRIVCCYFKCDIFIVSINLVYDNWKAHSEQENDFSPTLS